MANEKQEKKTPEIDVDAMVDNHVQKALKALEQFMDMTQEQVDKIVEAMTVAGQENHTRLAKMAVEETGRGVYEDKIIKNMFATEYIWHSIKNEKTVGIVEENELEGYVEIAEPVGVVAAATPVTNPTSTTMFKSLICMKSRNPVIFGFHPSAQQCSVEAAKVLYDAAVKALEILFRFSRKTYNDICSKGNIRYGITDLVYKLQILFFVITAVHDL